MKAKVCVYPFCSLTRSRGGLCHGHYQAARRMIRNGISDQDDLIRRGLYIVGGEGGSGVSISTDGFRFGSSVLGKAKPWR